MEIKEGVAKNITNLVGVHLLKNTFYYLEVDELDAVFDATNSAEFANDETIIRIKGNVEKMKRLLQARSLLISKWQLLMENR